MAGHLDVGETASRLVRDALASGEWKHVRDADGRECYFNEATRETTRDLRVLLLKRFDWAKAGGIGAAASGTSPSALTHIDASAGGNAASASAADVAMLAEARRTIDAYEREVTELRLRLFGASRQPTVEGTRVHRPDYYGGAGTGTSTEQQSGSGDVETLKQQLAASRRLNAVLLDRVSTDRQTKNLCAVCLEKVAVGVAPVDHASILASEHITFPQSIAPFARSGVDPVTSRGMYGRDAHTYSNESRHGAAPSMPPSLGYLPRTFEPAVPTFQTLRPREQQSAPTSHAPLRQSAELATRIPRSGDGGGHAVPGSTAYPPASTLLRLPQPERYEDGRLVSSALGLDSSRQHASSSSPIPAGTTQTRRLTAGIPARLYDGGVHTAAAAAVGGATPAPSSSSVYNTTAAKGNHQDSSGGAYRQFSLA